MEIEVARIFRRDDARKVDPATVRGLVDSIAEVGIINPLRVRPVQRHVDGVLADAFEVTAGGHRLSAALKLGLVTVPCEVVTEDDIHAEMAMIDENLCRAELSVAQRAQSIARRKELYLELHPETAAGIAGAVGKHGAVANLAIAEKVVSFTAATSQATGKPERSVRRDAERGEKIAPDVLAELTGTRLDTGDYLDALKKLPHDKQRTKLARDLAAPPPQRKKLFVAADPIGDQESVEKQVARLMNAWNSAGPEARSEFLAKIDQPVFDRAANS